MQNLIPTNSPPIEPNPGLGYCALKWAQGRPNSFLFMFTICWEILSGLKVITASNILLPWQQYRELNILFSIFRSQLQQNWVVKCPYFFAVLLQPQNIYFGISSCGGNQFLEKEREIKNQCRMFKIFFFLIGYFSVPYQHYIECYFLETDSVGSPLRPFNIFLLHCAPHKEQMKTL